MDAMLIVTLRAAAKIYQRGEISVPESLDLGVLRLKERAAAKGNQRLIELVNERADNARQSAFASLDETARSWEIAPGILALDQSGNSEDRVKAELCYDLALFDLTDPA